MNRTDLTVLQQCFLFRGETEQELLSFFESDFCEVLSIAKGKVFFGTDKSADRLGLLLSGKATALCSDDSRGSLKTFSAGELFGAASVFCDNPNLRFGKIKAVSACRVLFISREGIEKLLYDKPDRALEYIRFLSSRVEFLNQRISTFTLNLTAPRFAKYILMNAEDNVCRAVNFTHLAKTLNISRSSLYRARNELVDSGVIRIDGRNVVITDKDALKNIL